MRCSTKESNGLRGRGGEEGSAVYTFLGVAIIAAVVIGILLVFPWGEVFKGEEDENFPKATAALAKKKWNDAISLFAKSLESNPENAAAYVGRSRAYLQLGDLDKAFKEVELALKHDSRSALAFGQKGIVEKLKGQPDQALADFSTAVDLNPAYSWAYGQIADIYMRKSDLAKALENVNKAVELRPKFVEGLRLRARILTRMGKCKEAFDDFVKAEKLSPDDVMALQDKAWFLLTCPDEKVQDPNKAMELARKAYTLSEGKDPLVQETLAEAFFQQGDPLTAAEHQKKAIELQKQKCPDGSCLKEMEERLRKYELSARKEKRNHYEILPLDGGYFRK